MQLSKYRKAVVAALGVILTGLNVLYGTNPTVQMVISVCTLLGVYQAKNEGTL